MKHCRSSAETEIREAVVAFMRHHRPNSRIVHELNMHGQGSRRADLAVVGTEELILVEIKSERDKLERLAEQVKVFSRASHHTVVVAHEKWFKQAGNPNYVVPCDDLKVAERDATLWCYPESDPAAFYRWRMDQRWLRRGPEPHAEMLLWMLWRAELDEECAKHRIAVPRRTNMHEIIREMCWHMTGMEVCHAVCRQLRQRVFAEADEPIREAA